MRLKICEVFDNFEENGKRIENAGATTTENGKLNYVLNTMPEDYSYIGLKCQKWKIENKKILMKNSMV